MGSSFIKFRGRGFWTRDTNIQFLLKLAVKVLDAKFSGPEYRGLRELKETWSTVANEEPTGALDLRLDDLITSDGIKGQVLNLIDSTLDQLSQRRAVVTKQELSDAFGEPFERDVPVSGFHSTGDALQALLRGESRPTEPQIVDRKDPNWRGGNPPA